MVRRTRARSFWLSFFVSVVLPAPGSPQGIAPILLEIPSGGEVLKGRFFPAVAEGPRPTFLLVPGWPGNPNDVLGLGALLPEFGFNVLMFNPRGMHGSSGTTTFAGVLDDIGAVWEWLHSADVVGGFRVDTARTALGGHSFGGGMALAYAARDARVRRVVSIAGNDHAAFVRELDRSPAMAAEILAMLRSTQTPDGPVRFDPEAGLREVRENAGVYDLRENAPRLADRAILLIGGWEDTQVSIEGILLPLYRALKGAGAGDVRFVTFHDDHGFARVRGELARAMADWLRRDNGHP